MNAEPASGLDPPTIIIQPSRGWVPLDLREFWAYRELLYFLVWGAVKVRYKQTILGAAWAILQPFTTMVVFTIFFGNMANIGSDGLPYPIFSYAGLLPWTFFANGLGQASNSLVGSANLLKKVYFPRLIIPITSVLGGVVDFFLAFSVLFAMMAWYQVWPRAEIVLLPLLLLLAFATALGMSLWLSALNVEFRDVRYIVPFFTQLWMFITPVIYPLSRVTGKLEEIGLPEWLYGLNPMVAVVQGSRWILLGSQAPATSTLAAGAAVAAVLLVSGLFYFRRMERSFADVA
ncbi:MAG: ABC transporter permease [bacterium]|nr:ABC transporter permease [bacterium]